MNIERIYFKVTRHARAARFWLLLALAALAWVGFGGDAKAQDYANCYDSNEYQFAWECPSRQVAYAQAKLAAQQNILNTRGEPGIFLRFEHYASHAVRAVYRRTATAHEHYGARVWPVGSDDCPAGLAWDDASETCKCPPGSTYTPEGCKSCGELNDDPGYHGVGSIDRARDFKSTCLGGCIYEAVPMQSTCTLVVGAPAGAVDCSGRFAFTGQSCTVGGGEPAEVPPPEQLGQTAPQVCRPAGSGQTFCQKPNGDQCYTASTGKQICWGASETGEKGDGPVLQTRNAGDTPIPPNLTTHGGDTLTSSGDPVTTVTTRNNTTITTTTRNYTTEFGTDAKPRDSGEPDDGSGGTDDSGDDDTSASGGESCENPPIVSGDAALNMVANQAWATRCAVEEGNAAAVTGDVGDCGSPFTVEGTNANAEKLRAMRAQICGAEARADASNQGASDGLASMTDLADALMPGEGDSVFADEGQGPGDISRTRFGAGGGACPLIGIGLPGIGVIDTTEICSIIAALRLLFIGLATIWAIRIVGGQ